jgi:hypothetical protein
MVTAAPWCAMLRATRESSMAAGKVWQRRITATGVAAAAILAPLWAAAPASAASLCAPPADTVAPQITSLTLSTPSVDLNSGSRVVTITAGAIDTSGNGTASGVKAIQVELRGPRRFGESNLTLASGTAIDGVWTGTYTVPKAGPAGAWSINFVFLEDAAHNSQTYSNGTTNADSPTDIRLQSGWDTTFTVTGTGPTPPAKVKPGPLTGFTMSPQSVNTTKAAKVVHVTATFSAPLPKHLLLFFIRTGGRGIQQPGRVLFKQTSPGHWTGKVTVHRWAGDETARPELFASYGPNVRPRGKNFSPQELTVKHFASKLTIVSGVDKTRPVLTSLTFSPPTVNTTSGAQTVTVTATASDTQSGVKRINANLYINNGSNGSAAGFYPFPGLGFFRSSNLNVKFTRSGNQWIGTVKFRECVPSGNWKINAFVTDRAGNATFYSSKKLIAAELPGTLAVTSTHGDVDPPSIRGAVALDYDHSIVLDFTEGVKNVSTSTLSVFDLKPTATRFQSTTPVTSIDCYRLGTLVDCSGSGGLVTSAVLFVPAVKGEAKFQVYANLNSVTSQLTDGAGNPLGWEGYAASVTGA